MTCVQIEDSKSYRAYKIRIKVRLRRVSSYTVTTLTHTHSPKPYFNFPSKNHYSLLHFNLFFFFFLRFLSRGNISQVEIYHFKFKIIKVNKENVHSLNVFIYKRNLEKAELFNWNWRLVLDFSLFLFKWVSIDIVYTQDVFQLI